MFKRAERWWNARTPIWLHNGTKQNFLFQIIATVICVGGIESYEWWKARREAQRQNNLYLVK